MQTFEGKGIPDQGNSTCKGPEAGTQAWRTPGAYGRGHSRCPIGPKHLVLPPPPHIRTRRPF